MAIHDKYRTNNGKYFFEFAFEDKGSCYYVHILKQPSYQGRDSGLHTTHRLESDYSGCNYRVCFGSDDDARTLTKARKFTEAWAEATAKYIKTGRTFG